MSLIPVKAKRDKGMSGLEVKSDARRLGQREVGVLHTSVRFKDIYTGALTDLRIVS